MQPISDILNRIRWHPRLNLSDFTIFYHDRHLDVLISENAQNLYRNPDEEVRSDKSRFLPFHRIRKVEYRGKVIWERK